MNNQLAHPTKEEGYRFIREDEILEAGDEFWDAFQMEWCPMSELSVGMPLDADSVGRFRRIK